MNRLSAARDQLRSTLPGPVTGIPVSAQTDAVIRLPLCPSTNNLFKNAIGKGRVRSAEYKRWLETAGLLLNRARPGKVASPVIVIIRVGKCNQARDLDNMAKPVLDLLSHAGVIQNDNLMHVHEVRIVRAFSDVAAEWIEVSVESIDLRLTGAK